MGALVTGDVYAKSSARILAEGVKVRLGISSGLGAVKACR